MQAEAIQEDEEGSLLSFVDDLDYDDYIGQLEDAERKAVLQV